MATISVKAEVETINVDVEAAEITDTKLVDFLRGSIVPFLKANDIHPIYDEVFIHSVSGDSIFNITAINGTSGLPSIYASVRYPHYKLFLTTIDDVRFYITAQEDGNSWFKPTHTKVHLGQFQKEKDDLLHLTWSDDECQWTVKRVNDNGYRITGFIGEWSSWFKNKKARPFMPNAPVRLLNDEQRERTPSTTEDTCAVLLD